MCPPGRFVPAHVPTRLSPLPSYWYSDRVTEMDELVIDSWNWSESNRLLLHMSCFMKRNCHQLVGPLQLGCGHGRRNSRNHAAYTEHLQPAQASMNMTTAGRLREDIEKHLNILNLRATHNKIDFRT